ncbi:hypothetical protein B1218_34755 [Pseudomonas ogarae]|nr:hypothetical protein B1218_34755 [Pseudomonas ogarae]
MKEGSERREVGALCSAVGVQSGSSLHQLRGKGGVRRAGMEESSRYNMGVVGAALAEGGSGRGAEAGRVGWGGACYGGAALGVGRVVDSAVAGDALSAGYVRSRVLGGRTVEAAGAGKVLASRGIQGPGALMPKD